MAHNIFSHALAAAVQFEGSTQALAHTLRVPEGTLLRWLAGRAMMPVRAFARLLDVLADHEMLVAEEPADDANRSVLTFTLNKVAARCAHCEASEFVACTPALKLRYSSLLACRACGAQVQHRTLLLSLGMLHARQSGNPRPRRAVTGPPATRVAAPE